MSLWQIPGQGHTYSKRRYASNAPIIARSKGGRAYDEHGRSWVDWGMGINNVLIGHAEDVVDEAAIAALRNGQSHSRPSLLEGAAADAVLQLWPQASMIKFAKNGSDAVNAALRLARAVTKRQNFAFDSTAPFHSTADWFCGRLPKNAGTCAGELGYAYTFKFNDPQSVHALFARTRGELACLILEPGRFERPTPEFIQTVHELCWRHGTLLVIDAIVFGYRVAVGDFWGFEPDLFTLGKGMANGYSVAALCGRKEMKRGELDGDVFLLSTTNGAEQSGLAACIATQAFYREHDVIGALEQQGAALGNIVKELAPAAVDLRLEGDSPARQAFAVILPTGVGADVFHSTLIDHGVLWPYTWCCPCYRRTTEEMDITRAALTAACAAVTQQVNT